MDNREALEAIRESLPMIIIDSSSNKRIREQSHLSIYFSDRKKNIKVRWVLGSFSIDPSSSKNTFFNIDRRGDWSNPETPYNSIKRYLINPNHPYINNTGPDILKITRVVIIANEGIQSVYNHLLDITQTGKVFNTTNKECPICNENLSDTVCILKDHEIHGFHCNCISSWGATLMANPEITTISCPMCRKECDGIESGTLATQSNAFGTSKRLKKYLQYINTFF